MIFACFRLSEKLPSSIDLLIQVFKNSKENSHSFRILTGISPPVDLLFFKSWITLSNSSNKTTQKEKLPKFLNFLMFFSAWMIFIFFIILLILSKDLVFERSSEFIFSNGSEVFIKSVGDFVIF